MAGTAHAGGKEKCLRLDGSYSTEYWRQSATAYFTLMLAARITLAHFSVCSAMNLPYSAGEPEPNRDGFVNLFPNKY